MSSQLPHPDPLTRSPRRYRRLWVALVVVTAGIIGGFVWWRKPPAPSPPVIDLSSSEPEVAEVVQGALAAVTAKPRNAAAWGELGMILRAHDFDGESVQAFQTAEQLDPADWRWPYLQGLTLILLDPEAGLACLRRAADHSPPDRPEARLRLAEVLFERGQAEEAGAIVRSVLDRQPGNARGAILLGRLAAGRGDWKTVLAITESHRDDPACRKRVAALRGEARERLGETTEAAEEWKRVGELPEDGSWPDRLVEDVVGRAVGTTARMKQASALLADGRPDAAIDLLQETIHRAPGAAADARLLLGQTLIRRGDPEAARHVLQELTARVPDSVEGWFQRGVAEFFVGDATAAAGSFARVVELKPDHALGHFNLGHARKKLGDRAGAMAAFEATLRCRPDHEPSRKALKELRSEK